MKIYNYHPLTGEYISVSDADKSPLEKDVYLVPANATKTKPPQFSDNQVACFKDSAWEISDDYRGVEYWLEDGSKKIINEIGETVPENGSESLIEAPAYATEAIALQAVNAFAQSFTANITGPVPLDEKLSWDAKYAAALAVKENTATSDQETLINDEAAITGEDMADLANVIIAKAKIYKRIVSRVAGLRRAMTAQIEAESDPYKYEDILNAGKIKAGELAENLGLTVS